MCGESHDTELTQEMLLEEGGLENWDHKTQKKTQEGIYDHSKITLVNFLVSNIK